MKQVIAQSNELKYRRYMYYVVWCARSSISNATRLRPAYIALWPFLYILVQKLSDFFILYGLKCDSAQQ